ncbi:MAG: Fe-S-containing hydro-lyase [Ignavibacteriales bacterium]
MKRMTTPLSDEMARGLHAGEQVLISGIIYTGRDAAHKRLVEMMERGDPLPMEPAGQIIYYVGPCPPKPGQAIGSAGPTTSGRMDAYTPALIERGLKGMIGKGTRREAVVNAMKQYGAVYFIATGGAGALLAKRIKKAEVLAFPDLGPEAVYRLEVEDFPVVVGIDSTGRDLCAEGVRKYRRC